MKTIRWGMIGCGSVTEVKSGPAFNKAPHSKLIAITIHFLFKISFKAVQMTIIPMH